MFESFGRFFGNLVNRSASESAAPVVTAMAQGPVNVEKRDFDLKSLEAQRVFVFGIPQAEGIPPVTEETALGLAPFFSAIRYLSQGIAMLDREVVRKTKSGTTVADKHPLSSFFLGAPHYHYSWFDFLSALMVNACLGNGYARIWRDEITMRPEMLEHIPSSMVYPEYGRDGSLWYRVSGELNGRMVTEMVPAYDMIHIKGFTTNAITGKRISLVHSSTIGAGLAAQRYSENVYGRGAHSSFAVKYDQALEEKEATDIEDRIWNRIGGMDKTGRPFVLDDGMDIERLQWSPDEVLLIDFSRLSAEHASMITQVPMEMLRSESTGTYGAALMRSQNFLTHGLQPYIEKIQEEFNRKLFWVKEYNQRKVFFRFDTSMYVRMDKETEMNVLTGFVAGGVLTPNEARTRLGLVGLPGGDALYIPSTMVPAVNLITQQQSIGEPSGDAAAAVSGGEPQTDNKKLPKPSAVAKNQDIEDEAESGIVSAE